MKDNDLIERIRNAYLEARNPVLASTNIRRGTSRSISSITEDIFAKYVSDIVGNDFEVWIDPQISVNGVMNANKKRTLVIRPDIAIVRKCCFTIDMIFDLKMDLGYIRTTFSDHVKSRICDLNKIRGKSARCRLLKNNKIINFNNNLNWNYVLFSDQNINTADFQNVNNFFNGNQNAKLFVLMRGTHLNSYEDVNIGDRISQNDFNNLRNELQKLQVSAESGKA